MIAAKILPGGGGEADAVRGGVSGSGGGEEARRAGAGEDSKEVCVPKEPFISCQKSPLSHAKRALFLMPKEPVISCEKSPLSHAKRALCLMSKEASICKEPYMTFTKETC